MEKQNAINYGIPDPGDALEGARNLPLRLIDPNPRQSRQAFDLAALHELADSIREHGVLQPILVRPVGDRFQIFAGERRYHASEMAELKSIPAIVLERGDMETAFATAVENLQREQLDIEDEARTFAYLIELSGLSQRKLAKRLGLNHVYVSRRLKLLKHPDLMQAYRTGQMTLFEVLKQTDEVVDTEGNSADPSEEVPGTEASGSPSITEDYVLIERDDLPGYIVSRNRDDQRNSGADGDEGTVSPRNSSSPGTSSKTGSTRFRWQPALQFHSWLNRIQPQEIPANERASFKAQIAEIKAKLQEWEAVLGVEHEGEPEQKISTHLDEKSQATLATLDSLALLPHPPGSADDTGDLEDDSNRSNEEATTSRTRSIINAE